MEPNESKECLELLKIMVNRNELVHRSFIINNECTKGKEGEIIPVEYRENYSTKSLEKTWISNHELQVKKNTAIIQTAQMLAHDVRKPFSMVKSLLQMMDRSSTPDEIKRLSKNYIPVINSAIDSVNGMITDLMEVGSEKKLQLEPSSYQNILNSVLEDLFRNDKKSKITFQYNLCSQDSILVESARVKRVISNIISNAAQAVKGQGHMWFHSKLKKLQNTQMLECCIGNEGSHISQAVREQLFEAFYTHGKVNGTGLGLAIAKKIINNHGGDIRCESSTDKGVEFFFTLPISNEESPTTTPCMLKSSQEIYNQTPEISTQEKNTQEGSKLEANLYLSLEQHNRIFKILIIDDEAIYRNHIIDLVSTNSKLRKYLEFFHFANGDKLEKVLSESKPELILLDIDLGDLSENGFKLTERIRKSGYLDKICIHSNRGVFEYQDQVLEAGADLILPKPISKDQFLSLISSIISNPINGSHPKKSKNPLSRIKRIWNS